MTTYTLKLVSGVDYNLYNGTTLVSDADLATMFGSAGSAFFVFDFNSGTPTNTTSLTIVDSNSQAVITNTGLSGIAENTNFNGDWSASATAFDTFVKSPAAVLDEVQMSDLMGKIKGAGGIPTNATFWGQSYDTVNNKVDGNIVFSGSSSGLALSFGVLDVRSNDELRLTAGYNTAWSSAVTIERYAMKVAGKRISNVADPTSAQDAATKNYVDSIYPVGAVFTSTSATAPTIAGGTWTEIGTQTVGSSTVHYYERTA